MDKYQKNGQIQQSSQYTKVNEIHMTATITDDDDIFVLLETRLTDRNSRYKWKMLTIKIKMKIGKMQERSGNYRPIKCKVPTNIVNL